MLYPRAAAATKFFSGDGSGPTRASIKSTASGCGPQIIKTGRESERFDGFLNRRHDSFGMACCRMRKRSPWSRAWRTAGRLAMDALAFVSIGFRSRSRLAAENLFLRKQLALYAERRVKSRRATDAARITLVVLARLIDWKAALIIVKPETLIRWHRTGFRLFWRWKSAASGRPRVPVDVQVLIAAMRAQMRRGARSGLPRSWSSNSASGCHRGQYGDTCNGEDVCVIFSRLNGGATSYAIMRQPFWRAISL